jgi:hypothetical protein
MFTIASGNDNNSRWIADLLAEKKRRRHDIAGIVLFNPPADDYAKKRKPDGKKL